MVSRFVTLKTRLGSLLLPDPMIIRELVTPPVRNY